jgi:hypothetical protein
MSEELTCFSIARISKLLRAARLREMAQPNAP